MADLDREPLSLLTTSNPKTAKGEKSGYLTAILHLAPASLSGRNVCPHATDGCRAACLNTAGRGGIGLDADGLNPIQVARIRRTRAWQRNRAAFMLRLVDEIAAHELRAAAHGLKSAVRLNGTSDLPWERFSVGAFPNVFAAFPRTTFYDYTKWPARLRPLVARIPNYSLTYSLAESNAEQAAIALESDVNVAAVFDTRKGQSLPAWHVIHGRIARVVDGDASDLRFLDPQDGVIVGLRAKGRAAADRTGFVQHAEVPS